MTELRRFLRNDFQEFIVQKIGIFRRKKYNIKSLHNIIILDFSQKYKAITESF